VIPKIQVNRFYAGILRGGRDGGGTPVSQQMREARWLVRNIEQRFQTILRVAQAIVDHQSRYFDYGAMAMRPLTLGEIAAKVDLHESTVSRVTSRKYMATPRGLFEFKHFFGSHVETAAGNPCSATAVRALITELVSAEEGERPLSDIKLTRLLEQRGIKVARRTVSKYRGALQIPSVEVRRMSYRPTQ
jgi:RNA polymerase sigma-54 factor